MQMVGMDQNYTASRQMYKRDLYEMAHRRGAGMNSLNQNVYNISHHMIITYYYTYNRHTQAARKDGKRAINRLPSSPIKGRLYA